jgi:hypothetical protein
MSKSNAAEELHEARINVRVKGPMAAHLETVTGPNGLYENQSVIRHDMADHAPYDLETGLLEGYAQLARGNFRKGEMSKVIARAEREMREEDRG